MRAVCSAEAAAQNPLTASFYSQIRSIAQDRSIAQVRSIDQVRGPYRARNGAAAVVCGEGPARGPRVERRDARAAAGAPDVGDGEEAAARVHNDAVVGGSHEHVRGKVARRVAVQNARRQQRHRRVREHRRREQRDQAQDLNPKFRTRKTREFSLKCAPSFQRVLSRRARKARTHGTRARHAPQQRAPSSTSLLLSSGSAGSNVDLLLNRARKDGDEEEGEGEGE